ncbi:MAG: hypothetical protein WDO74_19655 [Pseudomonadota bacterium]
MLEGLGFLFGELAGFDQLVDQRLVPTDLGEAVTAQHVGAAVTDLSHEQARVHQRRNRGGGAHAAPGAIGTRLVENTNSGFFDGLYQPPREVIVMERRLAAPAFRR